MTPETTDAFRRLESWTQTLARHVKSELPVVRETIAGHRPLPAGCPSKASLAEMELRHIEQDIDEITSAFAAILKGIAKE